MPKVDSANGAVGQKADIDFSSSSEDEDQLHQLLHQKVKSSINKNLISIEDESPRSMVHVEPLYAHDNVVNDDNSDSIIKKKKKKKNHDEKKSGTLSEKLAKKKNHVGKPEKKDIRDAITFQCETCDKLFPRNFDLERHKKTHTGVREHKCDICSKAFAQKSHLKKHLGTHAKAAAVTQSPQSNKCKDCEKEFSSKSSLERHVITHTADRPYACDVCDKEFKQKVHLKKHMASVHDGGSSSDQENQSDKEENQSDKEENQSDDEDKDHDDGEDGV